MIKMIMFDLDGTLADTLWAIRRALNLTMKKYGFPEHEYSEVRKMVGNGARNLVMQACPKGTFDTDEEFFNEVYKSYCTFCIETHLDTKECYDGLDEVLTRFKEAGYTLAVLSNKQNAFVADIVNQILPTGLISYSQGHSDLPLKPDPTAALMIAEKFGFKPEECAYVGDSDVDIMTAKNAGMLAVSVTWGYRDKDTLLALSADVYADTPSELERVFIK